MHSMHALKRKLHAAYHVPVRVQTEYKYIKNTRADLRPGIKPIKLKAWNIYGTETVDEDIKITM